jgi:hypothetical protein
MVKHYSYELQSFLVKLKVCKVIESVCIETKKKEAIRYSYSIDDFMFDVFCKHMYVLGNRNFTVRTLPVGFQRLRVKGAVRVRGLSEVKQYPSGSG